MKYICDICGWEYDEAVGDVDNGIAAGTKFEDLPDDFVCPLCGVGKEDFSKAEQKKRTQVRFGFCSFCYAGGMQETD